jgi:hypothetical protein
MVMEETECNIPPRRPSRRWKYNIKMDRKVIGWEGLDWIHLGQEKHKWQALINTVFNLRGPENTDNLLTSYVTSSFSRTKLVVWFEGWLFVSQLLGYLSIYLSIYLFSC